MIHYNNDESVTQCWDGGIVLLGTGVRWFSLREVTSSQSWWVLRSGHLTNQRWVFYCINQWEVSITWSSPTVSLRPSWSWSGNSLSDLVTLSPTLLFLLPKLSSSPTHELGSHSSWQNWTVATKLTVGVLGNLNALKSAMRALVSLSSSRDGKMSSLRGQPDWSIKLRSSPLSVLASRFLANSPNAESWIVIGQLRWILDSDWLPDQSQSWAEDLHQVPQHQLCLLQVFSQLSFVHLGLVSFIQCWSMIGHYLKILWFDWLLTRSRSCICDNISSCWLEWNTEIKIDLFISDQKWSLENIWPKPYFTFQRDDDKKK